MKIIELCDFREIRPRLPEIQLTLQEDGIIALRGLIKPETIHNAMDEMLNDKRELEDIKKSEKIIYGKSKNFNRLDIGEYSSIRFCRTWFYFPWQTRPKCINLVFETLKKACLEINHESGLKEIPETKNKIYFADRIIQYFKGGGFMSGHKDSSHINNYKAINEGFATSHIAACLIKKERKNYDSGGGWMKPEGKNKIYWEQEVKDGDIIVYNGMAEHGVDGIDREKKLDMKKDSGRFYATTTPYFFN